MKFSWFRWSGQELSLEESTIMSSRFLWHNERYCPSRNNSNSNGAQPNMIPEKQNTDAIEQTFVKRRNENGIAGVTSLCGCRCRCCRMSFVVSLSSQIQSAINWSVLSSWIASPLWYRLQRLASWWLEASSETAAARIWSSFSGSKSWVSFDILILWFFRKKLRYSNLPFFHVAGSSIV